MIYTVTFNPAIDYVMTVPDFRTDEVNRSEREQIFFGGKGINVSLVLRELGVPSKALGFVAGFTGAAIEDGIRGAGVDANFIHLAEGCSRINVKLKSGEETEINGQGPVIPESAVEQLMDRLKSLCEGDILVLAGSIPSSMPQDIYSRIMAVLPSGVRTVVDASGELLKKVLPHRPYLIKPNNHELGGIFGVEIATQDEAAHYAQKLRDMGAQNVLVSMAGEGAVLVDEYGKVHKCGVCKGTVRNSVGAGDSMVAGFLAGIKDGYEKALRLGTAAGGATAFSEGLAERALIMSLLEQL